MQRFVSSSDDSLADPLDATPKLDAELAEALRGSAAPTRPAIAQDAARQQVLAGLGMAESDEPRHFGRYLVLGVLGRGGMGTVLQAHDAELDRKVALKLLHTGALARQAERLRKEAQALARLDHPNVVEVFEVGEAEGQAFVAMQMIEGLTLARWQTQAARSWRECVAVYLQAGAGVAAAHEAGLVHRDFKPANCIIDNTGRVRVLDFGLVQEVEVEGDAPRGEASDPIDSLQSWPTRPGTYWLGTPGYMAPELFDGEAADRRSDQFSFCVSVYEAIFGRRPFVGKTAAALAASTRLGRIQEPPAGVKVPARLRKAIERGLAVHPDDRWPSMEALLQELRSWSAPVAKPRWVWGAVAGVAVATVGVAAGLGLPRYAEVMNRCTGARTELDGIWDRSRQETVTAAIIATELPYAAGTAERVRVGLSRYADQWTDKHTQVCEATAVRGEQSEPTMELRMSCLRVRKTALRAAVETLVHADADVVRNAVDVVAKLPALSQCDDVERLAQRQERLTPPEDPRLELEVDAQRRQLARVRVLDAAGSYAHALEEIGPIAQSAEALGYMPLLAETWLLRGVLHDHAGQYAEAEADLERAYTLAVEHEHDAVMFGAAAQLTFVVGLKLTRHAEGLQWAQTASPLAARSDEPTWVSTSEAALGSVRLSEGLYEDAEQHFRRALQAEVHALGPPSAASGTHFNSLGAALLRQGKLVEALHVYERALQIRKRVLGPRHPHVAAALANVGTTVDRLGRYAEAERHHRQALAILLPVLGEDHLDVAMSLSNLAAALDVQGQLEESEILGRRALEIRKKALGDEHPFVAESAHNLGRVLSGLGRYEDAEEHYRSAHKILATVLGEEHPHVAMSLDSLGIAVNKQGRHEEAERHHRRAAEIREKAFGPEHPKVAASIINLGVAVFSQQRFDEATDLYERALKIRQEALGPDHPDVAIILSCLGEVTLAQRDLDTAERYHRQALTIRERALGPDHPDVASSLLGVAEVELSREHFAAAKRLAERALAIRETATVGALEVAEARLFLARILWHDHGERARARVLAAEARDGLVEKNGRHHELRAAATQWLAAHRLG